MTLLGLTITSYAYVFIFDARNGVGLAVILFTVFCAAFIGRLVIGVFNSLRASSFKATGGILTILITMALTLVTAWAVKEHVQYNPGWSSMWEDTKPQYRSTNTPTGKTPIGWVIPKMVQISQ